MLCYAFMYQMHFKYFLLSELHTRIFDQCTSTPSKVETGVANKQYHELGSSNLQQRCHNSRSLFQRVLDAQCIQEQRIKALLDHQFLETSVLNSPSESELSSQPIEKKNVKLLGANFSLSSKKISSNHLVESKKVFEILQLHSTKQGILGSQTTRGNQSARFFGSNLCLNGTNRSFINQENPKKISKVLGLHSPRGSTLSS